MPPPGSPEAKTPDRAVRGEALEFDDSPSIAKRAREGASRLFRGVVNLLTPERRTEQQDMEVEQQEETEQQQQEPPKLKLKAKGKDERARKGIDLENERDRRIMKSQQIRAKKKEKQVQHARDPSKEGEEAKTQEAQEELSAEARSEESKTPTQGRRWAEGQKAWVLWGDALEDEGMQWKKASIYEFSKSGRSVSVKLDACGTESNWIRRSLWDRELRERGDEDEPPQQTQGNGDRERSRSRDRGTREKGDGEGSPSPRSRC
jgi:hypothetical protein